MIDWFYLNELSSLFYIIGLMITIKLFMKYYYFVQNKKLVNNNNTDINKNKAMPIKKEMRLKKQNTKADYTIIRVNEEDYAKIIKLVDDIKEKLSDLNL